MNKFKLNFNWLATWISALSLVMSPVALGQEAQNISAQQAQRVLAQLGLNRQITVGEFFQKNKHLYPERIRVQLEPVFMNYKNVLMPEFTVTTVQGSDGREIPNVRVSQNGQLINMQWFGEKDRFLKFQNTNLNEADIVNFEDMFTRILAGDETLRKQTEPKPSASKQIEYPSVTKASWKAMSVRDRANYMINMRLLWSDAKKVINESKKEKKSAIKKTSSLEKIELFWKGLFQDADAESRSPKRGDSGTSRKLVTNKPVISGSSDACLVAGYVTTYSSSICDHNNIKKEYRELAIVKKANEYCGATKLACNPIVFGTPGGKPICLTPSTSSSSSFQIATHYNGPCETINGTGNNHLGPETRFLKDPEKRQGRYADDNLLTKDIEAEVQKSLAGNYKATEDFLNGLLVFDGKNPITSGVIDDATLEEVIKIKNQFNHDIAEATASCKASSEKNVKHEKNFWAACDQLQRRFLFVAEYFQSKCPQGTIINKDTLKCSCADKSEVIPGATCAPVKPEEPTPVTPPPVTAPTEPVKPPVVTPQPGSCDDFPGASGAMVKNGRCICPDGSMPKEEVSGADTGAKSFSCSTRPSASGKKEPGFWGSIQKGLKVVAPFAMAGGVAFLMYKLFSPKKPSLNPAGDRCPNGALPPCAQMCAPPLALQSSGSCGCSACPPSQTITNAATCTCGSFSGGTTTQYTCWDGTTKVDDLSKCPAQQYTCWDGTKVTNPLNCPEKPATVIPKTGIAK